MNKIPDVLEQNILSYLDDCKCNDNSNYNLVCKSWNNKFNYKCYKIKVFNRIICGSHNENIINMIRNSMFYTY
jgi:hypothetical protein